MAEEAIWTAQCISFPGTHKQDHGVHPIRLRKAFSVPGDCRRARLRVTALGIYVAYLNGARIGDEHLSPGWTSYHHRLQYQVFDVTGLLKEGAINTLAIEVADGWYAGRLLWRGGTTCLYGDRIGAICQLEMFEGEDLIEPSHRLATDDTWESRLSPIVSASIYHGEHYDMRLEEHGWNDVKMLDSVSQSWTTAEIIPFLPGELVPQSCPPVRIVQTIRPIRVFTSPSGKALIDFGQNLVGKLLVSLLHRPQGHRLQFRHAEVLEHGELGTRPLRDAKATDSVIFGEDGQLSNWSPEFTYHGFRYVEIQGWSQNDATDPLTEDSLSALVLQTDMTRTGFFECSSDELNKLHNNIVWSMRGNFLSIPTDCPQRDERLGWTGDIQVFGPTAAFLYDCDTMLTNWMRDLITDQKDWDGVVPFVVPNALKKGPLPPMPQAVWGDVVVLLPWTLYTWYGEERVLRESYQGMKDHLDKSIRRGEDGLWDLDLWQFGDWLDPNAPPQDPGLARTDGTLVADAYLVRVTDIMSKISGILGYAEDAKRYASDAGRLRALFQDKYIAKSGLLVGDSQTSLALSLLFRLHADPEQRRAASSRLARLVRYAKFKVSTGFAGTPAILHALSSTGHTQLAYRMLLERDCPSWLYQVRMGATTMWERWDSMLPDGSINPGEMTSFNHYALGSVASWMHANIGGISTLEPGWRKFLFRPRPGGDITSAKVEFTSASGLVKCHWQVDVDIFTASLVVPENATAIVILPDRPDGDGDDDGETGGSNKTVGPGEHSFRCTYQPPGPWPPKALYTEFREG